jgi:hypothetical protein
MDFDLELSTEGYDMNIVFGLLLSCIAPVIGAYLGKAIAKRGWLSTRMHVFFASLPIIGLCAWLAMSYPWAAIAIALAGFFALREGRAYPVSLSNYGGSAAGPFGGYRPRVSDGATWGDVHHRDRNIVAYSQKSDLREMQEGAFGSIGSVFGKRFDRHPPVIHRQRPAHAKLVVDNGHFPPQGTSAKRGQLKSVK